MIVAAMLMAAAGGDKQAPVVLEPATKWAVNYAETSCMLGRVFADGESRVVLTWRALPLEETFELIVQIRSANTVFRRGVVDVTLEPGASGRYVFESFPTSVSGQRIFRVRVNPEQFSTLPDQTIMTLAPSNGPDMKFMMSGAAKAFKALETCNDDTLREWKIDAAAEKRAVSRAKPLNEKQFAQGFEYPSDAIARGRQGVTAALFTIGLEGRVTDCRIVIKSGSDDMDNMVCTRLMRAGRYRPAVGADGKPMISHVTGRVNWVLPDVWQDDAAYRAFIEKYRKEYDAAHDQP